MRRITKATTSAGLAAAVVVTGLSFGPAAVAAQTTSFAAAGTTRTSLPALVPVVAGKQGPATTLVRGESNTVFAHGEFLQPSTNYLSGKVVVTAPRGTTLSPGQDAIAGERRFGTSWTESHHTRLVDGKRSADGSTYTYTWAATGGGSIGRGEFRFGVKVDAPATSDAVDGTLIARMDGTSGAGGSFATTASTSTRIPALSEVISGVTGPTTALNRGGDQTVHAHGRFLRSGTHSVQAKVVFTAPEGTTFTSEQANLNGDVRWSSGWSQNYRLTLTNGQRSADGTTYTYTWANGTSALGSTAEFRFPIKVSASATTNAVDGVLSAKVTGTSSSGAFAATSTTPTRVPELTNVVGGARGPATTLNRGGGKTVYAHGKHLQADTHSIRGKVVFTAPENTIFSAGQNSIQGEAKWTSGWSENYRFSLTDGTLSADRTTYTYTWSTDSKPLGSATEFRFPIIVITPEKSNSVDGSLTTTMSGGTSKGAFSATSTTATSIPASSGVIAGEQGPATTLDRGGDQTVYAHGKHLQADTHSIGAKVVFTAPENTTFTAGQDSIHGEAKWSSGWSHNYRFSLTDGQRSADGTTYTYTWATDSKPLGTAAAFRFPITVNTPTKSNSVDGMLTTKMTGSTSNGAFEAIATTATRIPASTEIIDGKQGPTTTLTPGGDRTVYAHGKHLKADTHSIGGKVVFTAPENTTFPVGQDSIHGEAKWDSGWSHNYRFSLTNGQRSADGTIYTYTWATDSKPLGSAAEFRFPITVNTPAETKTVDGALAATMTGASSNGSFTATGTTQTRVAVVTDPTGTVTFSDDVTEKASVSGTGHEGATIDLFTGTEKIGTAKVVDGKWSTTIDAPGSGSHTIRIEQSGVEGVQIAETTADYGDAVAVTTPGNGSRFPDSTMTLEGVTSAGSQVEVFEGATKVATATVTGTTFTADVDQIQAGAHEYTVRQHAKGALVTSARLQVTRVPAHVGVTLSNPLPGTEFEPDKTMTFTGTGTPGATVSLDPNVSGATIVTGVVGWDGNWTINRFLGNGDYTFSVIQNADGTETRVDGITLKSIGIALPFEVTGPANGSEHRNEVVTFTGTGTAGHTVTLDPRVAGLPALTATVKTDGKWSLDRYIGDGPYDFSVVQTNPSGAETGRLDSLKLNPVASVDLPFAVTAPIDGSTFTPNTVTAFTGTGKAGATITISTPASTADVTTVVKGDGTWTVDRYLGNGRYAFTITMSVEGQDDESSEIAISPASA